jgi:hypothetical protein
MDDESGFPEFLDAMDPDGDPTPLGIVQCLKMLAEEAASLGMARTLDALQATIKVCATEGNTTDELTEDDDLRLRAAGSSLVH